MKSNTATVVTLASLRALGSCSVYNEHERPEFSFKRSSPNASVSAPWKTEFLYTFHVNISDVSKPHATDFNGNPVENAHVIQTSYDLTWNGVSNTTLPSKIRSLTFGTTAEFPQSVVNAYDPSSPGDCAAPFGNTCYDAFTKIQQEGGCDVDLASFKIPACQSVFADFGSFDANEIDLTYPSPAQQTFYTLTSQPYSGANETALDVELQRLQVAFMTLQRNTTSGAATTSTEVSQAFCFIARPGEQSSSTTSTSTSTSTSTGGVAGPTVFAGVGVMALAGVGVVAGML